MLGAISGWLGITASKKEVIKREIRIMDAIDAHIKWKARLLSYLDGTSEEKLDPAGISRDDQCALGKWIHGPALKHFHDRAEFHTLRADHAQFHRIAGTVVKKVQEKDRAAADALMKNEYAQASRKVVQALTDLNKQVMG
jgi:methyl-accepting chemotaxis protein